MLLDSICGAIKGRRVLSVVYHSSQRIVELYAHGTSRRGREMLLVYQRTGASATGARSGWKALNVDEIELVEIVDLAITSERPDYQPSRSKNLATVHCSL